MSTTIVVGVDGSDAGAAALRWAVDEAALRDADLHMIYAWQLDAAEALGGYPAPWLAVENDARATAQKWVEDQIGPIDDGPTPRELSVVSGTPGPVLVEAARDASMLVVGTQVHKGLSRVFYGSVSHYCLTHATTTVVAVPAPVDDA